MPRQEPYPGYGWPPPRRSAIATFFKCCAFVAVVGILCGTGLVVGTLGVTNCRMGSVLDFANKAIKDLPAALRDSVPALADAVADRRDPGYVKSIDLMGELVGDEDRHGNRAIIEVKNGGQEVVSMLAVRAVYLDRNGRPMSERIVYGATPLAVEGEWRGPLFPGVKRKIAIHCPPDASKVELEISELRVWEPDELDDDGGANSAAAQLPQKSHAIVARARMN